MNYPVKSVMKEQKIKNPLGDENRFKYIFLIKNFKVEKK